MVSNPSNVDPEDIKAFFQAGYKSVDETQVVRIETNKYFEFLMNLITSSGLVESILLGNILCIRRHHRARHSPHQTGSGQAEVCWPCGQLSR